MGRYNSGRPPTVTGRDPLALHWDGATWSIVPTPNPTWPGADDYDYATVAYDAGSGSPLWARRCVGTSATAHVVAVSPDGTKIFVTGWTYGAATKGDYVTIAYSA